ncbi:RADres1 [Biomphalaria pfeifferi]|uniref:RADres1 n=1 Tax=Biomphalaria pfeifferi TaxID=112525 RepID=A0AAD8BRP1_BIOPF|nr:RADres1 [Biomphalaria pfeifferi]
MSLINLPITASWRPVTTNKCPSKQTILFTIIFFMILIILYVVVGLKQEPKTEIKRFLNLLKGSSPKVLKVSYDFVTEPRKILSLKTIQNSSFQYYNGSNLTSIENYDGPNQTPTVTPFKSTIKKKELRMQATNYLTQYASLFEPNKTTTLKADPNKSSTIQTWWQAAAMIDWYFNAPRRHVCSEIKTMGNWLICQDPPYTVRPPCLVYSFGINYDFSFDDAMSLLGCEVHSFDPSMKTETMKRGNNSFFYKWGISFVNTNTFVPRLDFYVKSRQEWKVRTLKHLMKELGHEQRTIDVLKMDVEGYEWGIVSNLIETDVLKYVRQFMLEFHLFPNFPSMADYVHLYQTYTALREMGFIEYFNYPHPKALEKARFNNQCDVHFVNIYFNRTSQA